MGFALTPIFLKPKTPISDQDLLAQLGRAGLQKRATVDVYGTNKQWEGTLEQGVLRRKVLVSDGVFQYDIGAPISEQVALDEGNIFSSEEIQEIIQAEGREGLQQVIKAEKVCRATNDLVKRYLGTGLMEIRETIALQVYE